MNLCEERHFKQAFDEWNVRIQHFLFSRGLPKSEVADMVQDCFMRLWKNCNIVKYEQLGSYLFSIAKNLKIDHYRKQSVRLKYRATDNHKRELEDGQFALELEEFKNVLTDTIEAMPAGSKEVFLLHRFNKMSYKEIAESLEIGVKAVEKRMHTALSILAKKNINIKGRV